MALTHVSGSKVEEKFSYPLFGLTVGGTLAGFIIVLRILAPAAVWHTQFRAEAWKWLAAFLVVTLFNCFVEYFFHRYVLHKPAVSFLSRFYRQHTKHHNLTRIVRKRTPGGTEIPFVENLFPILEPEQGEASFFPWYTLAIFAGLLTPLLMLLQWILPSFPWFVAGFAALTASLALYEIFHAIEHWSLEKWGPLIEHPRWGGFWTKVYSFHLRHHAVIDCNEAISGFFTFPVADLAFGTCVIPKTLYVDGEEWAPAHFTSPRPCGFIRWCDRLADRMVKARRERAADGVVRDSAPVLHGMSLADCTRGERIAHRLTHGVGLALGGAALALLVVFSSLRGNAWHVVSFTVFGVTLLLLYLTSALYHGSRTAPWRRLLHKFDHAATFLLVAGTYTPFLLVSLRGPWGWTLFGVVWGLCIAGVVFQFFFAGRFRLISTIACLSLGWLVLIAIKPLIATVPHGGLWLLLAGGLCYTAGAFFYHWVRLRYHRTMWHTFVLSGSICHFLAVLLFLLPGR